MRTTSTLNTSKPVSKHAISRRMLLRGAAAGIGAAVGLPILDAMLDSNGEALAAGTPLPKRFGEFYWGNGVNIKSWYPSATGAAGSSRRC